MMGLIWALTALSAAIAGFGALSLAMDRHHEDVYGRGRTPGAKRRWLQLAGTVGLVVSLAASLMAQGSAQGWVLWFGVLTLAGLLVMSVLCYWPRWGPRGSVASVVALLVLLLLAKLM